MISLIRLILETIASFILILFAIPILTLAMLCWLFKNIIIYIREM